ncbi:radical SAM protein, partial [Candidatus Saccharibacteria bacterium]|nr:radical SAM protein [Candidatus Saccharibacteria bacterium]
MKTEIPFRNHNLDDDLRFASTGVVEQEARLSVVRRILLEDPSIDSQEIERKLGLSREDLLQIYSQLQKDPEYQAVSRSHYYSRRIMFLVAKAIVNDFASDPVYVEKLLSGQAVSSRVVELHATKGTCNYQCEMCLWSDKHDMTYKTQKMEGNGLMHLEDWKRVLTDIKAMGTKVVVFSGGGEVLLNADFFDILNHAHEIGLRTQLYTSGYNLKNLKPEQW